jgi:hypothetical protein
MIGLASCGGVITAPNLEVRRDIVRNILVQLRSAAADSDLFVDHGR